MAEEFIHVEARLVDMGNGPEVWIESNVDPYEGHAKIPAEKLGELMAALRKIQEQLGHPKVDPDAPERCEGCDQPIPDDGDKHYDNDDVLLCVDCWKELCEADSPQP